MNNDISKLISDKRKYINLRYNIQTTINKLNNCIANLDIPSNKLSSIYNIDSVSIDKNQIYKIRHDLIDKRNTLRNVVLVEINKQLKELNEGIEGA